MICQTRGGYLFLFRDKIRLQRRRGHCRGMDGLRIANIRCRTKNKKGR
jgi:hypothetical protein